MAVTKFRENGLIELPGVEVFAAGTQRDKSYTLADLDQMVANFNRFSAGQKPLLRVPAVLGHEESQELLERSDLPAAAWAKRAYRDGSVFKVDFEDVPRPIAKLLESKRYRTVSAEIYDEPPEGVPGEGKMLRRVAFLGGEIPQVKTLADIPMPQYAERGQPVSVLKFREARHSPRQRTVFLFSEVQSMSREEMLKKLGEMGFDTSTITDETPDSVIAEILRHQTSEPSQDPTKNADTEPDPSQAAKVDEGGAAAAPKVDKNFSPVGGAGVTGGSEGGDDGFKKPESHEAAKKLAEHHRKLAEKYAACKYDDEDEPGSESGMGAEYDEGAPSSDPSPGTGMPKPSATPPAAPDGTRHPTSVTMKYSEIAALVERKVNERLAQLPTIGKRLESLESQTRKRMAQEKKATITAFCERMKAEGKVIPAEVDAGLVDHLLSLDAERVIKFSEKDRCTQLDHAMRMIEARPRMAIFAERFRDPAASQGAEDAEVQKIEAHFERFRESFPKGFKRTDLVDGYKAARKTNDKLTADDFLKISA